MRGGRQHAAQPLDIGLGGMVVLGSERTEEDDAPAQVEPQAERRRPALDDCERCLRSDEKAQEPFEGLRARPEEASPLLDIRLDDRRHDRAVGGEGHRDALEELGAHGRIRGRRGDQVRPEQPEPDLIGLHDLVQGHTVRRPPPGGADRQLHLLRRRHPSFDDAPPVEARGEMTNRPVQRLECRAGEGAIAGNLSAACDDVAYHALPATVRAEHQLAQGR